MDKPVCALELVNDRNLNAVTELSPSVDFSVLPWFYFIVSL